MESKFGWLMTLIYGLAVASEIWVIGSESWTFWLAYGLSYGIALLCAIYFLLEFKYRKEMKP